MHSLQPTNSRQVPNDFFEKSAICGSAGLTEQVIQNELIQGLVIACRD